jgi:predicted RNA-binding protein YlxR (DUF448 family)
MARGGARRRRDGPERRCVVTGESGPTDRLIRFALSPQGEVVPDLAERLPGRGVWVTAEAGLVERAGKRGLFARGFKASATAPPDLAARVEAALARRLIDALAMARKAGLATAGFEQVRARLREAPVAALIEAADGSARQRAKLRGPAAEAALIDRLEAAELGLAFGRESVIHACLDRGGAADRAIREGRRLEGFRPRREGDATAGSSGGQVERTDAGGAGSDGTAPPS